MIYGIKRIKQPKKLNTLCTTMIIMTINSSDDNDYERDTFYALTDGNYGDYEDWKENGGDMDSLMDCLGY